MTAPFPPYLPQLAVPDVRPGPFQPGPTGGDSFAQAGGDLGKVLMALRQLSQTSQIENRQIDVHKQLGLGEIGAKQAEIQQKAAEEQYKQQQAAATQRRADQAGSAFLQTLPPNVRAALANAPPGTVPGLMKSMQEAGVVGEMPVSQREMDHYAELKKTDPAAAAQYWTLIQKPPGAVVNLNPGESAYGKGQGEAESGVFKTALEGTPKLLQSMDFAMKARQTAKTAVTGFGANAKLNVSRALAAFGGKSSGDKATDTQLLEKLAQDRVLALLASHSTGITRLTNQELQFLTSVSGGDITMQPEAITKIHTINLGSDVRQMQGWIDELRQQAIDYPAYAGPALARAKAIEQQLQPRLKAYNGYVQEEAQQEQNLNKTIDQFRKKALGGQQP
jgi:hypothetical protein